MAVTTKVSYLWLVDNEMYHNSGDGLQVNAGTTNQATTHHIYIGRNISHHNKQTGLWTKQAVDVIFSENAVFGHRHSSSAPGGGMGFQYAPEKVWFLFNEIFDNEYGIVAQSDSGLGSGTESYYIGNLICDIHYDPVYHGDSWADYNPETAWNHAGMRFAGGVNRYIISNTIYDVDAGINIANAGAAHLLNNVISSIGTQGESHIWDETGTLSGETNNNLLYQPGGSGRIRQYNTVYTPLTLPIGSGVNNIDAAPSFVNVGNEDFHLQSASPAIDTGTSSGVVQEVFDRFEQLYGINIRKDIEGTDRPQGATWDIGAYEYVSTGPGGQSTLTVSSTSGGSVTNPGTGTFSYDEGTVVSIQAAASASYHFVNWTGTAVNAGKVVNPNAVSTSVTVDADYTIQANFTAAPQPTSTLTVSSTSGGSVTNPGAGTFQYDDGTVVPIQATAAQNYDFVNWTGTAVNAGKVANPNAASTSLTVDADYTIQANFAAAPLPASTLTVSSTSGGSVTSPGEGAFTYDDGTVVPIQATAAQNYSFVNWTGTAVDAGKVANPNTASTTLTADADYTIQAHFAQQTQQDGTPPAIAGLSPSAGDIQAPLNSLVILHVTDVGSGVDPASVTITLDGNTIYTGDTLSYNSTFGHCCRTGTPANYAYAFQSNEDFDYDQTKVVTVNASDAGGMAMTEQSYSFTTEMRSFGQNKQVDQTVEKLDEAAPATARDSSGNIWAVWHTGPVGGRDIRVAKLAAGTDSFGVSVRPTAHSADQSNPAIAVGTDDRLYVVWQDNRQANNNNAGEWDIYISTSSDGVTWSIETRANDPNEGNQTNPAIVVDRRSPNYAYVAWQDDRSGNQDICVASSSDRFATKAVSQITSDTSNQMEPVVGADSSNTIYVLWTDARNPSNGYDIYGAASNAGPWANVPVVTKAADQSSPAIAIESAGSVLHMLWTDHTAGDNGIYYASSNGLPGNSLTGGNLIDDYAVNKGQSSPAIAVAGSTGAGLGVFACWRDERDVPTTRDTDIWFVQANSGSGTNVFVGDGDTNSNQAEPAMGIDQYGYPYIVWTDDRGGHTKIYFAASTYMKPTIMVSGQVSYDSLDVTIGTDPQDITDVDDASVTLLAGTCPYSVNISINEMSNPPNFAGLSLLNGYDFGPSEITFDIPVIITIPYAVTGAAGTPTAYWYNSRTGALSQDGITQIEIIQLTSSLHALRFKTTHLTPFFAMQPDGDDEGAGIGSGAGEGGGAGGGCELSGSNDAGAVEYFLPYGILALFMIVLKRKDRKRRTL
ncbi:MAG: hypothetical protein A2Z25_19685 [Planctomycetes bacterium RBG_16_55_9]|nr:MAG: hypothetical protein A2Z25_19685 [Planctomycetes bacterium RBG_16_55_9]